MTEISLVDSTRPQERRANSRLPDANPVLACTYSPEYKEEVQTTSNASRNGLYFQTRARHYLVGMLISVLHGYTPGNRYTSPTLGRVVRVDHLSESRSGIAVQALMR